MSVKSLEKEQLSLENGKEKNVENVKDISEAYPNRRKIRILILFIVLTIFAFFVTSLLLRYFTYSFYPPKSFYDLCENASDITPREYEAIKIQHKQGLAKPRKQKTSGEIMWSNFWNSDSSKCETYMNARVDCYMKKVRNFFESQTNIYRIAVIIYFIISTGLLVTTFLSLKKQKSHSSNFSVKQKQHLERHWNGLKFLFFIHLLFLIAFALTCIKIFYSSYSLSGPYTCFEEDPTVFWEFKEQFPKFIIPSGFGNISLIYICVFSVYLILTSIIFFM